MIYHRKGVNGHLEMLGGLLVTAIPHVQLSHVEMCQRVILLVADGILVGRDGLRGEVDATITVSHLHGPLAFQDSLFAGCMGIGLTILCGSIEVFADGIELIAFLHGLISPATDQQQGTDDAQDEDVTFSHTLLKRKDRHFIACLCHHFVSKGSR